MTLVTLIVVALLQAVTAARIGNVGGEVEIIRPTETAVAHTGDLVSDGDRLHTLKGASLALSTVSGVTLQLRSDTTLEMKKVSGEAIAFLTEGSASVTSAGKPVRIETRYGLIIGTEDSQEFDVSYRGDVVQVLVIRGSVRAELSDPLKVVFKNAADFGTRVYEAGSITPTVPRPASGTTVIIYPRVGNPTPSVGPKEESQNRPKVKPRLPVTPPVPPK